MIRKFAGDSVTDWDKYLPYLLSAYREAPCPATGYSPFELLYGRTVRGPMVVVKQSCQEQTSSDKHLITYVTEMRKRMTQTKEQVKKNVERAEEMQKSLYDRKSSKRSFRVGDKVPVLLPRQRTKIEAK